MSEWNRERLLGAAALILCVLMVVLAVWEAPELAPAALVTPDSFASAASSAAGSAADTALTTESRAVPTAGSSAAPSSAASTATFAISAGVAEKLNINTATKEDLAAALDGIGETLARRIVEYRETHGGFSSIEEIQNVSGIGEKRFAAIRDKITVG